MTVTQESARIAAIVLAAGRSTRMGSNKLLADWDSKPLVRHVAEAALASSARPVILVTGHQAAEITAVLAGLDLVGVHNSDYAAGMSTSLRAGIAAVPTICAGALVLLGDMPLIGSSVLDGLTAAFLGAEGARAAVPVSAAGWGNPVLISRELFPELASLTGDRGARALLEAHRDQVVEWTAPNDALHLDIDTPSALAALRAGETGPG